jgi:hypothetical protein
MRQRSVRLVTSQGKPHWRCKVDRCTAKRAHLGRRRGCWCAEERAQGAGGCACAALACNGETRDEKLCQALDDARQEILLNSGVPARRARQAEDIAREAAVCMPKVPTHVRAPRQGRSGRADAVAQGEGRGGGGTHVERAAVVVRRKRSKLTQLFLSHLDSCSHYGFCMVSDQFKL